MRRKLCFSVVVIGLNYWWWQIRFVSSSCLRGFLKVNFPLFYYQLWKQKRRAHKLCPNTFTSVSTVQFWLFLQPQIAIKTAGLASHQNIYIFCQFSFAWASDFIYVLRFSQESPLASSSYYTLHTFLGGGCLYGEAQFGIWYVKKIHSIVWYYSQSSVRSTIQVCNNWAASHNLEPCTALFSRLEAAALLYKGIWACALPSLTSW